MVQHTQVTFSITGATDAAHNSMPTEITTGASGEMESATGKETLLGLLESDTR